MRKAGTNMPQTLASDIARNSFTVALERLERQHDFSADEGRELLAGCEMGVLILERVWHLAQGFLDRGMERVKLTFLIKALMDVVELAAKAFDAARARVTRADLVPQEKEDG